MNCRLLLTLALVGLILFIELDAKAIKHKKHNKKAHIKHHKKEDLPTDGGAPAGNAPAPAATPDDMAPQGAPASANDDAPAAKPPMGAQKPPMGAQKPPMGGQNQIVDADGNGIDDNVQNQQLQQQPQLPGQPPAEEEEEGSASGEPQPPTNPYAGYLPPQLLGGHMLPGPTPDPFEMSLSEPRYCPEPCPQECAPGCYDWCCFPSIQVPAPPMQLMMIPVNNSLPTPAPVPAPLPYPMNYGPSGACYPNPCSAKKHEVTKNETVPAKEKSPVAPVKDLASSNNSSETIEEDNALLDNQTIPVETSASESENKNNSTEVIDDSDTAATVGDKKSSSNTSDVESTKKQQSSKFVKYKDDHDDLDMEANSDEDDL